MLSKFSNQLHASRRMRHLFFLAATVATVLLIGYQFGTFDEAMHIPFLKDMAYPGLYPGDSMLELHNIYYSYFWQFFIPFLKLGWLEPTLFIVHLATIYLTYWAVWDLSYTLFGNPLSSMFSVAAMIIPHFGFVGFPVVEFAPLSRTFVLPFLLIAINQFMRGRVVPAFFIAGVMYNVHVVSVNFILAMFGLACILEFSRIGFGKILSGLAVFIVAALPVLLWKVGGDPVDLSLRPGWVDLLNRTLFRHIFAMIGPYPATWLIVLSGISIWVMFFIATRYSSSKEMTNTARNFVYAGIIVIVVNVITANWLPITIIIQSQIARMGLWTLIIGYLFFANMLAHLYTEKSLPPFSFGLLATTFFFSPLPLIPVLTWFLVRNVKSMKIIKATAITLGIAVLASIITFLALDFWHPGIYVYGEKTPWIDVQNWARENTPINARFITPPQNWGVQEPDWRVHSERPTVATLSELLVAAFQPGYEDEWKPRFETLAPGALAQFNGDYFTNVELTRQAYDSLTNAQLYRAACRYNAQFVVVEKPFTHDFPVIYENSQFIVYDLTSAACSQ